MTAHVRPKDGVAPFTNSPGEMFAHELQGRQAEVEEGVALYSSTYTL